MVELVDTLVLGTSAYGVGVRLPLAAHSFSRLIKMSQISKNIGLLVLLRRNMFSLSKSRLVIMGFILVGAILLLGGVYWMVEKPYPEFTYLNALEAIAIFTISGFDTDPPQHILGWAAAIFALMFGIVLVGAFTAEIAAIFVESRLKNHSAVKNINFSNHIIICGYLSDPSHLISQFFHTDNRNTKDKLVFLFTDSPSPQMEFFFK